MAHGDERPHKICIERYCTNCRGYVLSNEEIESDKFPCLNSPISCEISGFHRGVVETCILLGCYLKYVGSLPKFRNSLSVPF